MSSATVIVTGTDLLWVCLFHHCTEQLYFLCPRDFRKKWNFFSHQNHSPCPLLLIFSSSQNLSNLSVTKVAVTVTESCSSSNSNGSKSNSSWSNWSRSRSSRMVVWKKVRSRVGRCETVTTLLKRTVYPSFSFFFYLSIHRLTMTESKGLWQARIATAGTFLELKLFSLGCHPERPEICSDVEDSRGCCCCCFSCHGEGLQGVGGAGSGGGVDPRIMVGIKTTLHEGWI